jgi:hypothetical protein
MSASYEVEWRARFGDEAGLAPDLPDVPWLRQILMRRTHRRYAERPVPEPLLRLLLAAAFSASSKSDFQQASVIRVEDRGKLEGFFNAAIDAALVLQTFILAAETAGLGCCPISVIRNHAEAAAEILGLPDKVFPVAGLCVGYPAIAGHISMRLPLEVTVHTDHYDDQPLAEAIDAYDHRRDARYSLPREQQRSPENFGYASFYGWSEDKARQATQAEGQDFSRYLRARGFTFD